VLKGGTALNLFWSSLPRLSVDIDLNYVGNVDRDAMMQDRPVVEGALKALIESRGITIQFAPADEHAGAKWRLRHPNAFGGKFTLELDLNYLMRVPIGEPLPKRPYPIDEDLSFDFASVSFAELLGGKIKALLERSAARDLYDVAILARTSEPFDIGAIRRANVLLGVTSRKDWRGVDLSTIDAIDDEMIRDELTPVLRQDVAPNLLTLKSDARKVLGLALSRTDKEKEFLDAFLDEGEYRPELLFDKAEATRLKAHPALLWKLRNVKKFREDLRNPLNPPA
jgi:predicted nucleotidyltransferase component of viral defense system